jgi:hypothetical protein
MTTFSLGVLGARYSELRLRLCRARFFVMKMILVGSRKVANLFLISGILTSQNSRHDRLHQTAGVAAALAAHEAADGVAGGVEAGY